MEPITYVPIGWIRSPFKAPVGVPIQAVMSDVAGEVVVMPAHAEGLRDLEGFSHIMLFYHFHMSRDHSLTVRPFLDNEPHGVFCTRAPSRPNPVGISVVRLDRVQGTTLQVTGLDIVDGTPLLDIKPYIPQMDDRPGASVGWLEGKLDRIERARDDGRFTGDRPSGDHD